MSFCADYEGLSGESGELCSERARWAASSCLSRVVATGILLLFGVKSTAVAQEEVVGENEANQPASMRHVNYLGMEFVSLPGTHVLVATAETTVSQYADFLTATGYPRPEEPHFEQGPAHPVVGIGSADAVAFCEWLTAVEREKGLIGTKQRYRLPEKREWDLAVALVEPLTDTSALEQEVRNKTFFPWGAEWPPASGAGNFAADQLSGYEDSFVYTAPVKSFKANRYGIHDLAGNVWEWCESDTVAGTPQWVLRGGSWIYFVQECLLASYEYRVSAGLKASSFGFRCIFEDLDRAPELARELMAARKVGQEEARKRLVSRADGDVSDEEAAQRRKELLEKGFEMKDGEGDTGDEQSRIEERRRLMGRVPGSEGAVDADGDEPKIRERPEGYSARAGEVFENSLGLKFRPIDGMGALFGETEVRVSDFALYAAQTPGKDAPRASFKQALDHPVVRVSWSDAVAFCGWLTRIEREAGWISANQEYRLPLDSEWSLAAGIVGEAGETAAERSMSAVEFFPWGAEWPPPDRTANLDALKIKGYEDKSVYTAPVGKGPANAAGIFDLGGNVSEWCLDSWDETKDEKVVRGGSWMSVSRETLHSSYREGFGAASGRINVGFRCVLADR